MLGTVFNARGGPRSGVFLGDLNSNYRANFLYIGDNGNVDTWINQRGHGKGISNIKFGRIYESDRLDYTYLKKEADWFDVRVFENKGAGGTKRKGGGNFYYDVRGTGSDDLVWIYSDGRVDEINTNIHARPNWGHSTSITLTVPGPRVGIHLADWTGNGRCDVLVQSKSGTLTPYENNYNATANALTFTNRDVVASTGCTQGWGVSIFDRGMRLADIDGDGRADPLCFEKSGRLTAWLNRQSGLVDAGQIKFAEAWDRANLRLADLEHSGGTGIIWINKYSGAGRVFKNNGYVGKGGAAGGSSFSWSDRGVIYSGVDRDECLHFTNQGGLGRADLVNVNPGTNEAFTNFNECPGGSGGGDGSVVEAWKEFNLPTSQSGVKSGIDWNSDAVSELLGGTGDGIPDGRKKSIQQIFDAASQVWTYGFLNPLWDEPYPWKWLWIRLFFTDFEPLSTVTDRMNNVLDKTARQSLTKWSYNRPSVWLHEATYMDYFMNTPYYGPIIEDLEFQYYKEIPDSFLLFALAKWAETYSIEKKYPWIPYVSSLDMPAGEPWRIGYSDGKDGDDLPEFNDLPAPDIEPILP
ncbi:hypothetical protein GGR51DRAFT_567603 [Nemania sp. FL0031]|nr:hypothetical protein GGR51DRAFT_567603 [Nemania sp. FL0031]